VARLNSSCVICSKFNLELWSLGLSIWNSMNSIPFARPPAWNMAVNEMTTFWLKSVSLNDWPGGSQLMRTTPLIFQNIVSMAFSDHGSSWNRFVSPIHIESGLVFRKIQLSSLVITSRKQICDCASRILRSAFVLSTRFLRSFSISMYETHLKWRHWRLRDLVICFWTAILGMCKSSLNIRSNESGIPSNCFRIAASTSSSDSIPDRGSSQIEIRPILKLWTQRCLETRV
jgi:hypothetical protein